MSSGPNRCPPVSSGEAGTQEDAIAYTSSGVASDIRRSIRIPSTPRTLPISCGSATTVVVPWGSTARANSPGRSLVDSMCMCPSMNPGTRIRPDTSWVRSAR